MVLQRHEAGQHLHARLGHVLHHGGGLGCLHGPDLGHVGLLEGGLEEGVGRESGEEMSLA